MHCPRFVLMSPEGKYWASTSVQTLLLKMNTNLKVAEKSTNDFMSINNCDQPKKRKLHIFCNFCIVFLSCFILLWYLRNHLRPILSNLICSWGTLYLSTMNILRAPAGFDKFFITWYAAEFKIKVTLRYLTTSFIRQWTHSVIWDTVYQSWHLLLPSFRLCGDVQRNVLRTSYCSHLSRGKPCVAWLHQLNHLPVWMIVT